MSSNKDPQWGEIIVLSGIMSVSIFIFIMLISFIFNYKHMQYIGPIILVIIFILFVLLLYYRRDRKNIFILSLLNVTPIYPLGYAYANDKIIPVFTFNPFSIQLTDLIFFAIHFFTPMIDPFITFIAASLNLYPVAPGYKLTYF